MTSNMETITVNCKTCGAGIDILPLAGYSEGICEQCSAREARKAAFAQLENHRSEQWDKITAGFSTYLDTNFDKLPDKDASNFCLQWKYGRTGLNMFGPTGLGKTRTALLILKREFNAGRTIKLLGPGTFSRICSKLQFNTAAFEHALSTVQILLLDDVDKCILSPVHTGKFFSVIEARCASGIPTIVTHETKDEMIKKNLGCGEGLARRLRDPFLFTSIQFGSNYVDNPY